MPFGNQWIASHFSLCIFSVFFTGQNIIQVKHLYTFYKSKVKSGHAVCTLSHPGPHHPTGLKLCFTAKTRCGKKKKNGSGEFLPKEVLESTNSLVFLHAPTRSCWYLSQLSLVFKKCLTTTNWCTDEMAQHFTVGSWIPSS